MAIGSHISGARSEDGPSSERSLLVLAAVFLAINGGMLAIQRPVDSIGIAVSLATWLLCVSLGHISLNRLLPQRDPLLYPLVMLLSGWGLIVIERLTSDISPVFADRQAVWLVVATLALLATAATPALLQILDRYRYLWLLAGLVLLGSTILLGTNPSGQPGAPRLWLNIAGFHFQPSEILKVLLVAFLASYLAEAHTVHNPAAGRHALLRLYGPVALMWSLSVLLLIWQRELGTALIFFLVFLALLQLATNDSRVSLVGAALILAAGTLAYLTIDLVRLRVDVWVNPWPSAQDEAFQIVQSLEAFTVGAVFGKGVGLGLPTTIPVAHSDFVFAAVAEEWGLLGAFAVLGALAVFFSRGMRTAAALHQRPYAALMAAGLSLLIALQSIVILSGIVRLFPLTGVTLPYMSYGGSSLFVSFVVLGMLLRLSHEARSEPTVDAELDD